MTASAAQACRFVDPLEVFRMRCEARAILTASCDMDLHEAVDGLQAAAEASGLIARIGQDAIQAEMAAAFARGREAPLAPAPRRAPAARAVPYYFVAERGVASAAQMQRDIDAATARRLDGRLPTSTVAALRVVIARQDRPALQAWLAQRPPDELVLIRQMLRRPT